MVNVLLFIHCLLSLQFCGGVGGGGGLVTVSLFCGLVLGALSSLAIILLRMRELAALLWLCCVAVFVLTVSFLHGALYELVCSL